MPKIKTLVIFLGTSYLLFFIGIILWATTLLKLPTALFEYLVLIAACVLSMIGMFKASKLLKSSFTKEQIRVIMVAFNIFAATVIIIVLSVVLVAVAGILVYTKTLYHS